ncbi:hypothetical protein [Paraburkholderia humisilvae]|uniref:Uncharacterized protein n=1 Tax=Paraburkholderia humisilvae TaxID=627669 RepID=A0A6J5F0I9_9BURK|nr:hypothetical protein [Paraburkholderia humisilvae]CAB3770796.1 hypothetical protein LMG29542_06444 [Paraburkholderia humisilvae]
MERFIRILNGDDRRALAWLNAHVGLGRVSAAPQQLAATAGRPVYVPVVYRCLGGWPPTPPHPVHEPQDDTIASQHLAQIRRILSGRTAAATSTTSRHYFPLTARIGL